MKLSRDCYSQQDWGLEEKGTPDLGNGGAWPQPSFSTFPSRKREQRQAQGLHLVVSLIECKLIHRKQKCNHSMETFNGALKKDPDPPPLPSPRESYKNKLRRIKHIPIPKAEA